MWYTSCYILFKLTVYILFIWFLYAFHIHSIYIPDTLKVKMKVKKWWPEKLKMVKKHFFPEMFGDLWGVICYHHWYPRAGLEGREKSYFKKRRSKKMQNYPLSIVHAAVRPESLPGADLSTFWKIRFSLFSGLFGPFRAQFSKFFVRRVVRKCCFRKHFSNWKWCRINP